MTMYRVNNQRECTMNFTKRLHAFSLCLLLSGGMTGFAEVAHAKKKASAPVPAPQIDNAYASPLNQFTPGSELTFTVEGTPNGKASIRIAGMRRVLNLPEIEKGIYTTDYTISSSDRLTASSMLRATLSVRGRSSAFNAPLGSGAGSAAPAPAAAAAIPAVVAAPAAPRAAALSVQKFTVTPVAAIEPGAELKFTLSGTPGAKARFTIDGIARNVAMQETRPGQYEGAYTIRRLDHFPANLNIVGTIEANGQSSNQRLNQALVVDAKPPVIKNLSPRENEVVSTNPVLVSATFDDAGGVGIDTRTIRIVLNGLDITSNSTITPQFFTYRADLRAGTYPVDVSGKDMAGNTVNRRWVFSVAAQAAPVTTVLPLLIVSPANNAQVGSGAIEVRGRSAADAKVDVEVQAIAQIAGFFGLNQRIFSHSVRADANGNFAFTFQPQIAVPGARYEISMTASKAELTKELKLVLFQQK